MKQTILLLPVIGFMPLSAQTYHNDTTVNGVQTLQVDGDLSVKQYGGGLGGNLGVIGGAHIAQGGVSLPGMPTGVTGAYYGTFKLGASLNVAEYVFEKEGNDTTGDFIVPLGRFGAGEGTAITLDILTGPADVDSGSAHFELMTKRHDGEGLLTAVKHVAYSGGKGIKLHGFSTHGVTFLFLEFDATSWDNVVQNHRANIRISSIGSIDPYNRDGLFSLASPIRLMDTLTSDGLFGNQMTHSLNADSIKLNGAVSIASGVGASPNIVLNGGSGRISLSGSGSGIYSGANPILTLDGTGGVSFAGGSMLNVANTTASSSSTTGALTVNGGLGVGKDAYINGVRVGKGGGNKGYNTALGINSLFENTSGNNNTSVGFESLFSNDSGTDNTAVGLWAMRGNIGGVKNTVVGSYAASGDNWGSGNVAVGAMAMGSAAYALNNTVIGVDAGKYIYDCADNIMIGNNSGSMIGGLSGEPHYHAYYSIYIGSNVRGAYQDNNSIVIGSGSISEGSNTTVIGNSSTVRSKIFGSLETPNNLKVGGNTTLEGNVTISVPQGDISMGIYQ